MGAMARITAEELAAWVKASCAAQGIPERVADPAVLAQVGTLLGGRQGEPPHGAQRRGGSPAGAPTAAR